MNDQEREAAILEGIPEDELGPFLEWRVRVHGSNISEKTLLATDYLNHFNEIVMLVEMVPDMPDMLEECLAWRSKSYADHFRDSGFSEKDLAIAAYDRVPLKFRTPFEATIAQMEAVVHFAVERMAEAIAQGDMDRLRVDCGASVDMMHRIIQIANGIIHGAAHTMQQDEIDIYLGH
jgi:hypothetical protein